MKNYLVGCLYAPTAMSTLALLAYLFMYKKNYSTKTLGILYLTIILVTASTGLAVSIVLTNLLNLQTFYLIALSFVTGFFICHLLGLTNKNLKKLTQAKKTTAPTLWRSYRKALKKHTKTTLRKKLKYHYPIIGIGCLLAIMAVISLLDYWSAVSYDNNLEKYVACQAITLPKKLKTNYIFESISKQGKNIYTTFTLEDELSEKITPFFFKKFNPMH